MSKSTNILKAIVHLVKVEEATFTLNQNYQNKIQGQGEKLESYIKRLFSLRLNDEDLDPKLFKLKGKIDEKTIDIDADSLKKFRDVFSWLGSSNYPIDLKLKGGDCIEIKKKESGPFSGIALNSSPPRAKMKKDDPMIQIDMKTCEEDWHESDVLYVIGTVNQVDKGWKHLWMFYGDTLYDDQLFDDINSSLRKAIVPGSAADTNSLAGRTVAPCSTGLPG